MLETSYLSLARFPGIDRFDFEDVSLSRVLADEYGAEAVHVTLRFMKKGVNYTRIIE